MGRQVFSAESLGESTTAGTAWEVKTSLAFTPDPNRTYLILSTAQISNQNTPGTGPLCRLMHGASRRSADLFGMDGHPNGWWPIAHADVFASGASPAEETWTQEFARMGSSATVRIREGRLCTIRAEAGDLCARSDTELSNATSTYQDIVQITIPEARGDRRAPAPAPASPDRRAGRGGMNRSGKRMTLNRSTGASGAVLRRLAHRAAPPSSVR